MSEPASAKQLCCGPTKDVQQFDRWFEFAHPKPKTHAELGNWTFRRKTALSGWLAARDIPYAPTENSLTEWMITPLTPDTFDRLARSEAEVARSIKSSCLAPSNTPASLHQILLPRFHEAGALEETPP